MLKIKKVNMNVCIADFFCGVGGIRLGFELASKETETEINCSFSNDMEPKCNDTYKLNFNENIIIQDVCKIKTKKIPDFDIFLAGFPCQSFSIAGKRLGFDDDRGNMFLEIIRILKKKKPSVIFLENVKNLKSHDSGNTFKIIKEELEKIGYHLKYKIMNACEYGNTPQNRERIFIVGFLDVERYNLFEFPKKIKLTRKVEDLLEPDSLVANKYYYTEESKIYPKLENIKFGSVYQYRRHYVRENKSGVCPTLTANMGSGGNNIPLIKTYWGTRKLTPRECFNLQGFPKSFKLPKLADCHLYKQAGNSVNVIVVKRIARNILKVLTKNDELILERCFICGWTGCSKKHNELSKKTNDFITKARKVHGYRYDYSYVEYKNNKIKVKIICKKHEIFEQSPIEHTRGESGCPKCIGKNKTYNDFVFDARKIHGNKYEYPLFVYKNSLIKEKIICKNHGEFYMSYKSHIGKKCGCPECGKEKRGLSNRSNTKEFIEKSRNIHGDLYDYSKVKYITSSDNVIIGCKKHGDFQQQPNNHLSGNGCPKCAVENNGLKCRSNTEEFIEKAKKVYGNSYDYSKVKYETAITPIIIICPKPNHGKFSKTPNSFLAKHGCPICQSSKGEIKIHTELNNFEIKFESQYKKIKPYKYDFFIHEIKILIEYDGEQHFDPNMYYNQKLKKSFAEQLQTDILKTKLALENGYFIVRIPYTEYKRIHEILDDVIKNPRSLIVFSENNEEINKIYETHNLLIQNHKN